MVVMLARLGVCKYVFHVLGRGDGEGYPSECGELLLGDVPLMDARPVVDADGQHDEIYDGDELCARYKCHGVS